MAGDEDDFWVFGYGSLIWNPDFAYAEARKARLHGWHRALCILSHHYRGRPEAPGLVLGLDRGGSCRGVAFRVAGAGAGAVKAALIEREMISNVYVPRTAPLALEGGARVAGYFFAANRESPQYAGGLGQDALLAMVRNGVGSRGSSRDYLANTVEHLERLGLPDGRLARLLRQLDARP